MPARRAAVDFDPQELAKNRVKAANNALPVLVARAGGSVTITRQEFEEIAARYGGTSKMALRMERIGEGDAIRLTLVRKPAAQGELPV